ncbi:hypothetical protein DFH28DRAFT_159364 [Melampsora americana]|nr:hypothetical protein DFH28DRAFT_159364 [Melampsora americana]
MVASAQTATLPDPGMIRHDGYAITLPQPRSPGPHSEHHTRDLFYRHYPSAHFPGKFEPPENYPFIFPPLNHTESHFSSSPDEKTVHNNRASYLSPSIDGSYAPFHSSPSYPPLAQEPRLCHDESYSEYPTFRMSHASLSEEPVPSRVEYNPQPQPLPHQTSSLPPPPDGFVPYPTELPSSDYHRQSMHTYPYPYYPHPSRTLSSSEIHQAPIHSEYHNRGPSSAQIHHTERPFKCLTCPAGFNRNHDLKRHTRIHLAVKPFPCGWCEKSFSRKDALKRHLLVKGCAGDSQASVDESIRRAAATKPKKPRGGDPSRFTLPTSANSISPQMNQSPKENSSSPTGDSTFLSGSPACENRPSLMTNLDPDGLRYEQLDRLTKPAELTSEASPVNDRFAPYIRPAPYHHRSQPNILAYGRDSWHSSDFKPTGYNPLNEATAVLPPPRTSELPPTSSISSLLDGPDYGSEFRAAYSCTAPLYPHPSTTVAYPQSNNFSGDEYPRPLYHSTPRSHTSDSICSSSTMTTSNPATKSESPTATSQQHNSPSPPLTPNVVGNLNESKPIIGKEVPVSEPTSPDEYKIDIKREQTSRSPTPQEFPCISSIRCRPN